MGTMRDERHLHDRSAIAADYLGLRHIELTTQYYGDNCASFLNLEIGVYSK
jgi:hypothetical protein